MTLYAEVARVLWGEQASWSLMDIVFPVFTPLAEEIIDVQ
jgi:hypothetical protein